MEEEEDEDDEEGVGAGSNVGGLDGFGSEIPGGAFTSPPVALFSRSFFPGRRRRLATEEEQGEEVEEDVLEVGVAFFALRRVGLVTLAGARTFLCFCWLALPGSLPRDCRDSGSEHGFRNGERLSLSRRNTTAIEPPTTEEEPPTAPPGPMWSTPSFPAAPGAAVPVVLLTPSPHTHTHTPSPPPAPHLPPAWAQVACCSGFCLTREPVALRQRTRPNCEVTSPLQTMWPGRALILSDGPSAGGLL